MVKNINAKLIATALQVFMTLFRYRSIRLDYKDMLTEQYLFLMIFFTLQGHTNGKYAHELTDRNFNEAVSKEMVLVNFYTDTCPQCQQFKRTIEKAARTLHGIYRSIHLAQVTIL